MGKLRPDKLRFLTVADLVHLQCVPAVSSSHPPQRLPLQNNWEEGEVSTAGRRQCGPAGSRAAALSGFLPEQVQSLPCFPLPSFSSSWCAFLWSLSSQNQYDLGRGVTLFSPSLFFPPPPRKKLCVGDSLIPLVSMMILSFLCFSSFFFSFQFVSCYNLSVTSCHS